MRVPYCDHAVWDCEDGMLSCLGCARVVEVEIEDADDLAAARAFARDEWDRVVDMIERYEASKDDPDMLTRLICGQVAKDFRFALRVAS